MAPSPWVTERLSQGDSVRACFFFRLEDAAGRGEILEKQLAQDGCRRISPDDYEAFLSTFPV
jgi:hypothetical protein